MLQCVAACCSVLQHVIVYCEEAKASGSVKEDKENVVSIIVSLWLWFVSLLLSLSLPFSSVSVAFAVAVYVVMCVCCM